MPNPKKWTRPVVLEHLEKMVLQIESAAIIFVGQYLAQHGISHPRFSEWKKDFKGDGEIEDLFARIKSAQETNLLLFGLSKKADAGLVKFCLINNHGWVDKKQQDIEVSEKMPKFVIGPADLEEKDE